MAQIDEILASIGDTSKIVSGSELMQVGSKAGNNHATFQAYTRDNTDFTASVELGVPESGTGKVIWSEAAELSGTSTTGAQAVVANITSGAKYRFRLRAGATSGLVVRATG